MKMIWKFQLTAKDIPMPQGADVVAFQFQNGVPTIWAIVDPSVARTPRRFEIIGTGHELPRAEDNCTYLGTAQDSPFVWHLFEILSIE